MSSEQRSEQALQATGDLKEATNSLSTKADVNELKMLMVKSNRAESSHSQSVEPAAEVTELALADALVPPKAGAHELVNQKAAAKSANKSTPY